MVCLCADMISVKAAFPRDELQREALVAHGNKGRRITIIMRKKEP